MTDQPPDKKPPLTLLRWFFAIVGGLLMLIAGGCGLFFAGIGFYSAIDGDRYGAMLIGMGLILGGVPTLIGWLIWRAAVKRDR